MENEPVINGYLRRMLELGGSDLHLSVDYPPKTRVHGNLQVLEDDVLDADRLAAIMQEICFPASRWDTYLAEHDLDFAHEIPGVARFRCNYLYNYHGMGCVLRQIPSKIMTIDELKLPPVLKEICEIPSGLILVTGPTGSGKTKITITSPGDYDYWFKSAKTTAPSILYGDIPSAATGWQKLTLSTGVADEVSPNAATDNKFTVVKVSEAGTVIAGTTGNLTLKS